MQIRICPNLGAHASDLQTIPVLKLKDMGSHIR